MDKDTRNRIQRATQAARALLEHEYAEQLEGVFDILLDGTIAAEPGQHLDAGQHLLRTKLATAVEHQRATGMKKADAVAAHIREAAFTTLNRFVALKMLEARGLLHECISRGDRSAGFRESTGLASGLGQLPDHGYRVYIESLFDEIGREVRVLFDRRDPASLLWPRRQTLLDLLVILNDTELASVWREDETIGWVYQYFNSDGERKQMRAESQAPRNSRELAVRNQFFTPRYVVQFLTDNTLGRIWYEMRHGATRFLDLDFLVHRPNDVFLADGEECPPDAAESGDENLSPEELLKNTVYVPFRAKKDPRDFKILDPACGSGHFLLYAFGLMLTIYEEAWADEMSPAYEATGRTLREDYPEPQLLWSAVPGLILRHNLHGIDIDPRCAQIAALALWMRVQQAYKDHAIGRDVRPRIKKTNIVVAEPMPGETELRREFIATLEPELAKLVEGIFDRMELAGEAGALLRIEHDIRNAVREVDGEHGQLFRATDEERWQQVEERVLLALQDYADRATNGRVFLRRLFADDAARGLGLIDICGQRYDVVLVNPPFGLATKGTKSSVKQLYPDNWTDLYSAFVSRTLELLAPEGALGAITSNLWLSIKRQTNLRAQVSGPKRLRLVADLGGGVLDDATVNTALSVVDNLSAVQTHMVGFHSCREPETRETLLKHNAPTHVHLSTFSDIPTTPFCFELGTERISLWSKQEERFDPDLALTFKGNATFNDFRFLRAHWEVPVAGIGTDWIRYDKGGFFQPFFNPSVLLWRYERTAAENRAFQIKKYGTDAQVAQSGKHWEKSGLCYSRACSGFSPRVLVAGHVVNDKSIAILPKEDSQRIALLALLASTHVQDLLFAFGYHRSIEKGSVASLPLGPSTLCKLSTSLANLGQKAVEAMWRLEASVETSPVFLRPARSGERSREIGTVLDSLTLIDDRVSEALYPALSVKPLSTRKTELVEVVLNSRFAEHSTLLNDWVSHAVGIVFGRWSTSETTSALSEAIPDDLFSPLPRRQPGANDSLDGLASNGISHLDEGHDADLAALVTAALEEHPDPPDGSRDVREWLTRSFFLEHVARYSQSGRSGPIYWQLATPSASYSIWIYYHRFTKDTFYRVLNDYVSPKLQHEERKFASLTRAAGIDSSTTQRKEVDVQESVVTELRAFRDDINRVASLWNPDLNDGVIINFAPLWRLVPHHGAWQKECKATWDRLCKGDYDWAHLAMHLWPERVVPKCAEDRSLAIAHGLEDVFWYEDMDGKWQPRDVGQEAIDRLVKERTSAAVRDALRSLLEAPATGRSRRRKAPRAKGRRERTASIRPTAATSGVSPRSHSSAAVDPELLSRVKEAIAANSDGASKATVIDATGITASEWNKAIKALLADGSVTQTGERRGARYHLAGGDA